MRKRYVLKFDNKTNIVCYVWDNPEITTKGCIQIAHGMAEYILRYDEFANYLADQGYMVIGHDHYAHGESANSVEQIGIVTDYDFMDAILKGMKLVRDEFDDSFKNTKKILFAHSMGSMAAQRYIQKFPNDFDKVILSGTDLGGIKYYFGRIITKMNVKKHGPLSHVPLVENLTSKPFNKRYQADHPSFGWLSENLENIKKYDNDPLCGMPFPTNYYYSLCSLLQAANKNSNLKLINKNTSFFLYSGAGDPVSNYGKSVLKLKKRYQKYGLKVTTKIYEHARHEVHNENQLITKVLYQDILNFIEAK